MAPDPSRLEPLAEVRHDLGAYLADPQVAKAALDVLREHRLVACERPLGQVGDRVVRPPFAPQLSHRVVPLLPGRQLAQLLAALDFAVERLGVTLAVERPLAPSRVASSFAPTDFPLGDPSNARAIALLTFEFASESLRVCPPVELP